MIDWKRSIWIGFILLAAVGCAEPSKEQVKAPVEVAGKTTYQRYCFSCHASGVAGAPKAGNASDWAPRQAKGMDALLASTRSGIPPGMPPMGLCQDCTDQDFTDAINYMIDPSAR